MTPLTQGIDRDALLRHLEFSGRVCDLANEYADLGHAVLAQTLHCRAAELLALVWLPLTSEAIAPAENDLSGSKAVGPLDGDATPDEP